MFQPFLTLEANGQSVTGSKVVEQAFNTDGFGPEVNGSGPLYMDQKRPQWNNLVTLGDLAQVDVGGKLSGYEEWSYVASSTHQVPDAASTVVLLGLGLLTVECARRKFGSA